MPISMQNKAKESFTMTSSWMDVIVGLYYEWLEVVSRFASAFTIYPELSSSL